MHLYCAPSYVSDVKNISNIQRACFEFTTRGTQCLVYDGYLYSKNKTFENGTRVNWKCRFYHRLHCKARAQTRLIDGIEYVKVFKNEHSHPPETKSMCRRKRKIKRSASDDQYDRDAIAKFSTTQRGHPLLLCDGYSYIRNGEFYDTINWRCSLHRTQKCKAKAITLKQNGQDYVKLTCTMHNHPPGMKRKQWCKKPKARSIMPPEELQDHLDDIIELPEELLFAMEEGRLEIDCIEESQDAD
uniref:FLYWCH-type domain-containing protein n=1 Tax=Anopheles culicifacies TaxID=139723 RepID=A0A182MSS3_9DIPT